MNPNESPQQPGIEPVSVPESQVSNTAAEFPAPETTLQIPVETQEIVPVSPVADNQQPAAPFPQQPVTSDSSVPSQPIVGGFGSGGDAFSDQQNNVLQPTKKLSKKLIIIIVSIVAVIGLGIATFLLIPTMTGGKSTISSVIGGASKASSFTTYSGEGYTIQMPKSFKEVVSTEPPTDGVSVKSFNKTGVKSDTPITGISIIYSGYTDGVTSVTKTKEFDAALTTPVPDTATQKDVVFKKMSIGTLDAYKISGLRLKDGVAVSKSYSVYVMGKTKQYIFVVIIDQADQSSIDIDAIIDSIKVTE